MFWLDFFRKFSAFYRQKRLFFSFKVGNTDCVLNEPSALSCTICHMLNLLSLLCIPIGTGSGAANK